MQDLNILTSFACRHQPGPAVLARIAEKLDWAQPVQKIEITDLVPCGQVVFNNPEFRAPFLKVEWHRDGYLPTVSRSVLNAFNGDWAPVPTMALVYSKEEYLRDPEVLDMPDEVTRARAADYVLVAYVSPDRVRDSHRLAMNVAKDCYTGSDLKKDLAESATMGDLRVLVVD